MSEVDGVEVVGLIVVGDVKDDVGDETQELTGLEVESSVPRWIDEGAPGINHVLVVVVIVSDDVLIVVLLGQRLVVAGELVQGSVHVVVGSAGLDLGLHIWDSELHVVQKVGDVVGSQLINSRVNDVSKWVRVDEAFSEPLIVVNLVY